MSMRYSMAQLMYIGAEQNRSVLPKRNCTCITTLCQICKVQTKYEPKTGRASPGEFSGILGNSCSFLIRSYSVCTFTQSA